MNGQPGFRSERLPPILASAVLVRVTPANGFRITGPRDSLPTLRTLSVAHTGTFESTHGTLAHHSESKKPPNVIIPIGTERSGGEWRILSWNLSVSCLLPPARSGIKTALVQLLSSGRARSGGKGGKRASSVLSSPSLPM